MSEYICEDEADHFEKVEKKLDEIILLLKYLKKAEGKK